MPPIFYFVEFQIYFWRYCEPLGQPAEKPGMISLNAGSFPMRVSNLNPDLHSAWCGDAGHMLNLNQWGASEEANLNPGDERHIFADAHFGCVV